MIASAPLNVALIQELVNTREVELGNDRLTSPAELVAWLVEIGLLRKGSRLGRGDLRRAVQLREAVRELLEENSGRSISPSAVAGIDRLARRARLRGAFTNPRAPAADFDEALGRMLIAILEARSDGTWLRLKVCANEGCRWAFYDRSRNRSGQWCAMSVCGARLKMRAYRDRRLG